MAEVPMKQCPRCIEKPLSQFNKNRSRPDGYDWLCRTCTKLKRLLAKSEQVKKEKKVQPVLPPLEAAYKRFDERQAARSASAREKALIEENRKLQRERNEYLKLKPSTTIIAYTKAKWQRSDSIACAVLSDWHVEEPVEKAAVHGLNEYNLDIARNRSMHLFRNLLHLTDMLARESKINTIWLGLLGDFFSGFIHDELIANNELAPGDAAQFVKELLFAGIDFLLRESSYIIEGDAICGNHGRMTDQIWLGDPTGTSLESFMYASINDRYYNNPRVRIKVAKQAMVYRRFFESFNMRLIHGYEVKYGGGIGGITIPIRKALAAWNNPIRADLTVMGHFHQLFDGGDFLVNGSLIGYNTFAQAIKGTYEEPRQAFFLVHARNGGQKSLTAPIWLDAAHKQ